MQVGKVVEKRRRTQLRVGAVEGVPGGVRDGEGLVLVRAVGDEGGRREVGARVGDDGVEAAVRRDGSEVGVELRRETDREVGGLGGPAAGAGLAGHAVVDDGNVGVGRVGDRERRLDDGETDGGGLDGGEGGGGRDEGSEHHDGR